MIRTGQERSGLIRNDQDWSGMISDQVWTKYPGLVRNDQDLSGMIKTGQERSGLVRKDHDW